MMKDNMTSNFDKIDSGSIGFDFNKSGDYAYNEATMRPNPHLESGQSVQDASYTFNGDKTFNVKGKPSLNKKAYNAAKGAALDKLQASLLKKTDYTMISL